MIDLVGRCEQHGIVAVLANIAGQYMIDALANRIGSIVATEAIARNIGMIKICRYPASRRVTVVAGIAARDVPRILARCDRSVMAGSAGSNHLRVINVKGRAPYRGGMAVFATIGRLDVGKALASSGVTVVTIKTTPYHVGVVEYGRQPARCLVTVIAIFTRDYVIW